MPGFELTDGETLHRLRVSDVDRLIDVGAFDGDDTHVELLDGVLVAMSPQGDSHSLMTSWLGSRLTLRLGEDYRVFQHSSLQVGDRSLPEPDLFVVPAAALRRRHRPRTALLVIEIANSSHARDRRKAALYAKARVPEYWIVDLPGERVEIRTGPRAGAYGSIVTADRSATLQPTMLPGIAVSVDEMLRANVAPRRQRRRRH